jgi:DNA-binding transcriptional LysR family regulator
MDLKLLKNFLMVAKTGNMTRASAMLFITQSALSKQMKELESEFGCTFFERIGGGMKLTEEGLLLRNRAEDIVSLVDKTKQEFRDIEDIIGGDVHIGAPETCHIDIFAQELLAFRRKYPGLRCHVISGMTEQVTEKMDGGLLDFVIISGLPDTDKYNYIRYPADDIWGMVVRRDHPLAAMDKITIDDLLPHNIIISTQGLSEEISGWCGDQASELKVTDTVNLAYNGSRFVRENIAVMLTYKGLVDTSPENGLVWIPLYPELSTPTYLIWRKFQVFTPIVERFLEHLVTAFKKLSPDSSDND